MNQGNIGCRKVYSHIIMVLYTRSIGCNAKPGLARRGGWGRWGGGVREDTDNLGDQIWASREMLGEVKCIHSFIIYLSKNEECGKRPGDMIVS